MEVIGVLSDTHLHTLSSEFTSLFGPNGFFRDCTMILHAGDFTSAIILDYLEKQFVTHGVQGNMDDYDLRGRLPLKKIIEVDGLKIGMTHGWGAPFHLDKKVYEFFGNPSLDCIVFGHSHIPTNKMIRKTLMFNPGSFKGGTLSRKRRSVGKLFIEGGRIWGDIVGI